jgi:hypothetical protein
MGCVRRMARRGRFWGSKMEPAGETGKRGRPTKLTKKLAREICARLEAGESLLQICADPEMPNRSTVNRWLANDKEFRDNYAQARDASNDDEFDRMQELDLMLLDGRIKSDAHRSLIDSMKWRIAKRNPKKYGDKVNHEVTGREGGEIKFRWLKPGEEADDGD